MFECRTKQNKKQSYGQNQYQNSNSNCASLKFALMLPFVLLLGEFEVARVLPDVAAAADVDVAAADVAVVLMLLLNVELFSVCPADFIWPPHAETRFFCTNAKVRFFSSRHAADF